MSAARTMGRLRTALRLPLGRQALIAEASVALLVARVRGRAPFRVLARRLGGIVPPAAPLPPVARPTDAEGEAIRRVRWAVRTAAPAMPFRAMCLQQALAARAMLARRGVASVLHLGVDATEPALAAHAWLDAGGRPVTGYPVDPALVEVGRFVARGGAKAGPSAASAGAEVVPPAPVPVPGAGRDRLAVADETGADRAAAPAGGEAGRLVAPAGTEGRRTAPAKAGPSAARAGAKADRILTPAGTEGHCPASAGAGPSAAIAGAEAGRLLTPARTATDRPAGPAGTGARHAATPAAVETRRVVALAGTQADPAPAGTGVHPLPAPATDARG